MAGHEPVRPRAGNGRSATFRRARSSRPAEAGPAPHLGPHSLPLPPPSLPPPSVPRRAPALRTRPELQAEVQQLLGVNSLRTAAAGPEAGTPAAVVDVPADDHENILRGAARNDALDVTAHLAARDMANDIRDNRIDGVQVTTRSAAKRATVKSPISSSSRPNPTPGLVTPDVGHTRHWIDP